MNEAITILIVDDHQLVRQGIPHSWKRSPI